MASRAVPDNMWWFDRHSFTDSYDSDDSTATYYSGDDEELNPNNFICYHFEDIIESEVLNGLKSHSDIPDDIGPIIENEVLNGIKSHEDIPYDIGPSMHVMPPPPTVVSNVSAAVTSVNITLHQYHPFGYYFEQ